MNWKNKTRGGQEVRVYASDGAMPYCIHGAIKRSEGWVPVSWNNEGSYSNRGIEADDLIPEWVPKPGEPVWVFTNQGDYAIPRIVKTVFEDKRTVALYSYNSFRESDNWSLTHVYPWNNGEPPKCQ